MNNDTFQKPETLFTFCYRCNGKVLTAMFEQHKYRHMTLKEKRASLNQKHPCYCDGLYHPQGC